jgi:probable addiction module antidote protein
MTAIAKEAGVAREALYRSLSDTGDPKLSTLLKVMKALGVRLAPQRVEVTRSQKRRPA